MPLNLGKLATRAVVKPEFVDLWRETARAKLARIHDYAQSRPSWDRDSYISGMRGAIGRLSLIAAGISRPGKGLDFELSNLRQLHYETFDVYRAASGWLWFRGITGPLEIKEIRQVSYQAREVETVALWESQGYHVYVRQDAFAASNTKLIHFVPVGAPRAQGRHFHHRATLSAGAHPLDWDTYTCWSEFGTPVSSVLQAGDLVELLRLLRIFTETYYNGSPLCTPQHYPEMNDFVRRVGR